MAKMKVHELAKELNMQSKDICQALSEKGIELKPQSGISDEDAQYIRDRFSKKQADTVKVNEDKAKEKDEKKAKKLSEEKQIEEQKEEVKPKRLITTKGMVRPKRPDGERKRRPEGERRPRPEGERRPRPDGEKRPRPDGKRPKAEETKKMTMEERFAAALSRFDDNKEVKKVESVEAKTIEAKTTEVKITEANTAEVKVSEAKIPEPSGVKVNTEPVENLKNTKVEAEDMPEVKTTEVAITEKQVDKKEEHQMSSSQKATEKNVNNNNRGENRRGDYRTNEGRSDNRNNDRRNGDNRNNRVNDRNGKRFGNRNSDNHGSEKFSRNDRGDRRNNDRNGQNGDKFGNRNGDNRNSRGNDRFGNDKFGSDKFTGKGGDNRNGGDKFGGRGGDNRGGDRRNDRRRQDSAVSESVIQDKDRKARENKLRQDKQDRNKKNFEDGQRGGRNGRGMQLQHKSMLQKPQKKKEEKKEEIKVITIPEVLTIGELADKMKMQPSAIIKKLFLEGKMVTVNSEIDFETAEEIAMGFEIMCEQEEKVDVIEELLKEDAEDEETMVKRPPVVCVMGHVDHGKTSLLDAIKETNVISQEAGGITQHIGAYMVEINGEKITFLDTPGHEAFTAMRMRGAQSTDIAILVVAADDGVMPQTIEAINHAKAADIEIIVAINKIDKPGANIDRVKQELAEYELLAEDWGGNTIMVPVSAHTKEGIDTLLEMVILEADVLELKANPDRLARGLIIEAKLDKGKGSVATVLVQKGTLHVGDHIAAGSHYGRVRAMVDDKGRQVKEATPSTPVKILGLNGVPNAGEVLVATESGNEARSFAETFIKDSREKLLEGTKYRLSLDDLNSQIEAGNLKELNLIIKADVQGSVEAIKQSMLKLSNEEVEIKVIHGGVGAINESDVILASASNAIIIGFNVKPDNQAQEVADREQVDVRLYSVIYSAIEDVEAAMKGMLDPIFEEKVLGHAEIRQIFKASGVGNIAGSYVLDGIFERGCQVRITREGEQIFEGPLASLKRFKDDVKEVKSGFECGLVFEKFNDIAEGDMVEAYKMVEVPR